MNTKTQNCQNCQNPSGWLEEIKQFEQLLGGLIYADSKSDVIAKEGKRYGGHRFLWDGDTFAGVEEISETAQGATLKPLPAYGLIPLLATRSKKFLELWLSIPDELKTRYQVPGAPFTRQLKDRDFVAAALWPEESLEQSKALLGHCMALAPDWTLACLSEIRGTYAKRERFMPELLLMCFRRSEMAEPMAKGWKLLEEKYPSLENVDIIERKKYLRKKLNSLARADS